MNKKIILLVAVLLVVAIVFVACKGKGDNEDPTESTTESTSSTVELNDIGDQLDNSIIPSVYNENSFSGEGVIHIGGDSSAQDGEDTIEWDEVIGN